MGFFIFGKEQTTYYLYIIIKTHNIMSNKDKVLHARINMRGEVEKNIHAEISRSYSNISRPLDYWFKKHAYMVRTRLQYLNCLMLKPVA